MLKEVMQEKKFYRIIIASIYYLKELNNIFL